MSDIFALDTNIYIRAFRDPTRLTFLKRFHIRTGTRLRLNAVVALELRAGTRTSAQEAAVGDLLASYMMRERVIVPSFSAYVEGGRVLAALGARERVDVSRAGSLVNDVLIAASCREAGARLVTENVGDYTAVQRHLRGFRFVSGDEVFR
ncbi:MAG TPA: PIN domain-containing protein [Gemmatimonadaceae bacterium]|nr:PIN domain-containing protein [Gemmatimonadaceae bacterium]